MRSRLISDEYAAAMVDTRSRIHNKADGVLMTLHIPQKNVAAAFVEHFGVGDFSSYEHSRTGKVFNVVELEGHEAWEVLRRVRPYLISGRRYDADVALDRYDGVQSA